MGFDPAVNGLLRAGLFAFATADAFVAVWILTDIDTHRAGFAATFTIGAFGCIDLIMVERKAVKNPVYGTERTQIFAEWTADQHRKEHDE